MTDCVAEDDVVLIVYAACFNVTAFPAADFCVCPETIIQVDSQKRKIVEFLLLKEINLFVGELTELIPPIPVFP